MVSAQPSRRPGFTLVELLVVVSIIAILLALSASATVRVIDVQRVSNTELTVKVTSELLDRHWQAVVDKARNNYEAIPDALLQHPMVGGDARLARVIWVKLRLRQNFPMTFNEARTPAVAGIPELAPLPAYVNALAGVTPGPNTSESSVCLLLALQQARGGITFDAERLGSGAVAEAGAIGANATGLKQIVDGWGVGVAFFRWPTASPDLNPGGVGGQPGHNDPTDPEGLLAGPGLLGNNNFRMWFRSLCHPLPTGLSNPPRALSFKLIPVVVSAGRNNVFGLNSFAGVTNAEQANDNIYSNRLRFGARGD